MGAYNSFEDLEVYKDTLAFTVEIFELLKKEVFRYEYALNEQIKKAVISVSNNISEGYERETDRELVRFLYIAKGSAGEVRNLLNILQKIDYIEEKEYQKLKESVLLISKQLANYIKYVKKRSPMLFRLFSFIYF